MDLLKRFRAVPGTIADPGNGQAGTNEQEALRLIDEGNAIEDEGRIADALECYDAAVRLAPGLGRAHLNRGNMLLAMGDAESALQAYGTALVKDPDHAGAHYNMGNAYARSGRLQEALVAYRRAIALKPDFADAEVALGGALEDLGQLDDAVASYSRALKINPDYAEVHGNLGHTLFKQGRLDDAAASYRHALALGLQRAEVHNSLGAVLHKQGHLDDAVAIFRRAVEIAPDYVDAFCNLGDVLHGRGQLDEALGCYHRALELKPDHVLAHNNLGNVLKDLGQLEPAVASYRQALTFQSNSAAVHSNLGNAMRDLGQFDAAIASFRRALEIDSHNAVVHFNLGNVLQDTGHLHAAIESFRRALEIGPETADAHCNLGNALYGIGLLHDALARYRRALELKPDHVLAHNNLGNMLKDLGKADDAVESYREALRIDPDFGIAQSNLLFSLTYRTEQGAVSMLEEARRYGDLVARQARPFKVWPNVPDPARRLRVGFVSGDLRNHAVGHFIEAVLAAIASVAADSVEIFGYPTHFVTDAVTERIRASCSGWHSAVRLSDEGLAQRIRDDRIDILIDLAGHTEHNRLSMFAWKPAPVQASWLGYLATTGVAAIDYVIADPWTLPESDEVNFTEKVWRLPESYLCFTPPDMHAEVTPLPALARRRITFGSFNSLPKINDEVVAVWARLLTAVPNSQLFLKAKHFEEASVRQSIVERFGAHGIEAEQLVLAGFVPVTEYLIPYQRVDIALDPFPYPGITTSVESLWMGVPVLTLAGKTFLSRQGVGLLMNAGLPDWIAVDADDYVARAIAHAGDLHRLASLRSRLRQQMLASPIFDSARFANHFARALRGMWQQWCRKSTGGT